MQKGICPFFPLKPGTVPSTGNKSEAGMDMFKDDITTERVQNKIKSPGEGADTYDEWKYEIPVLKAVSIFRRDGMGSGTSTTVHVLEITARATVKDDLIGAKKRTELIKKVVEFERNL